MTNKTKAAIEGAAKLPTAESIPKPTGDVLLNVPHVLTQNGAYYHYTDVCSAIESHTAAHTAALRESIVALTHQRDFYRKKLNESKGVDIAKDLVIPENIEMAPIVQSSADALRERVKELQAKIASYESAIDGLKKVVDSLYNLK